MFPNDDICSVEVAKSAAQRLFKKYKSISNKEVPILGKNQVGKLMKDTYNAINMPYNPNEEDVFSFIDVFDTNNDGKIELKDFQEMAVKYLCGAQALCSIPKIPKIQDQVKKIMNQSQPQKTEINTKNEIKLEQKTSVQINQSKPIHSVTTQQKYKILTIETQKDLPVGNPFQRVYTPIASSQNNLRAFYSPKSKASYKESTISTNPSEISTPNTKNRLQEYIQKGNTIFGKYANKSGITQSMANKLISQTYELFGKKNFLPSIQDVKIWMKLCDRNKDGIVDWQDYKYFLQRSYERNQIQILQK